MEPQSTSEDEFINVIVKLPNLLEISCYVLQPEAIFGIRQVLHECTETCYITAYDLMWKNQLLPKYMDSSMVDEMENFSFQNGDVIELIPEESFTDRMARVHLLRLREILFADLDSLVIARERIDVAKQKKHRSFPLVSAEMSRPCNELAMALNPDLGIDEFRSSLVFEQCNTLNGIGKYLENIERNPPMALKDISFSGWNPVPANRLLQGDFFYIYVETLEEKKFTITASSRGFYINASKNDKFDPSQCKKTYQTLVGLIWDNSTKFKEIFPQILDKRSKKLPLESLNVPFVDFDWIGLKDVHKKNRVRLEESLVSWGTDSKAQQREWNEEFQSCRELPKHSTNERILRARSMFKVHSDFIEAAINGAKMVVHKTAIPINHSDPEIAHIFLQNNIFFSFSIDVEEETEETKKYDMDINARSLSNSDLKAIRMISSKDIDSIYTLETAIIDYLGYRVVAQSIIPGVFQGERGSQHVYGILDNGNSFVDHSEEYEILMKQLGDALLLKKNKLVASDGKTVEIYGGSHCKGILGTDRRYYVLDLISMIPHDANWKDVKSSVVRPELLECFAKDNPTIRFNPNLYNGLDIENAEKSLETNENKALIHSSALEDVKDLEKLALFITETQIPLFLSDVTNGKITPYDGSTLTSLLHRYGINVRYLGEIATLSSKASKRVFLQQICEREMVTRVVKHLLSEFLRKAPLEHGLKVIELCLNCLLGKKSKGKNRKKASTEIILDNGKFPIIPVMALRSRIQEMVSKKYKYSLPDSWFDQKYKIPLMREICKKMGLKLQCREYDFDLPNPVQSIDIIDIFPIVKHCEPQAMESRKLLLSGIRLKEERKYEEAFDVFSAAVVSIQQTQGVSNMQIAEAFDHMADILYNVVDLSQGIVHQHKSYLICRKLDGTDSALLISQHFKLGKFCAQVGQWMYAIRHYVRALYFLSLAFGEVENHPMTASLGNELAKAHLYLGKMEQSQKYLNLAVESASRNLEENDLERGDIHHQLALICGSKKEFRKAIESEKKANAIYKQHNSPKLEESDKYLQRFTKLAVQMQSEKIISQQHAFGIKNVV